MHGHSKQQFHSFLGLSVNIGDRKYMEDEFNVQINKQGLSYYGVYDGHSGNLASSFIRENLHKTFLNKIKKEEMTNKEKLEQAMTDSHLIVDKDFFTYEQQQKELKSNSGSTSTSLLLNESKF